MSLTHAPCLETDRLILRAPTAQDRAAYGRFYATSDVTVGGYRGSRTDAEVDSILARDIAHWNTHGFGMFLLHTREAEAFIGGTGLYHPEGWPMPELTWWLMPAARGTGYATEASLAVIRWAHDVLGWSAVETYMRDENTAARGLAERICARTGGRRDRRMTFPDGVTRDVYLLSARVTA